MDILREYLPFLIPYLILVVILAAISTVHILKHPRYRFGNKFIWIPVVCLIQIIGPIVYFAFGREED